MSQRHQRKLEEIKKQRPWDFPSDISMRLKDWWALSRWVPPFKVRTDEWLVVSKIVLDEDGIVFYFRENKVPSSGDLLISEWSEM